MRCVVLPVASAGTIHTVTSNPDRSTRHENVVRQVYLGRVMYSLVCYTMFLTTPFLGSYVRYWYVHNKNIRR